MARRSLRLEIQKLEDELDIICQEKSVFIHGRRYSLDRDGNMIEPPTRFKDDDNDPEPDGPSAPAHALATTSVRIPLHTTSTSPQDNDNIPSQVWVEYAENNHTTRVGFNLTAMERLNARGGLAIAEPSSNKGK
jgi:hypothetical protein